MNSGACYRFQIFLFYGCIVRRFVAVFTCKLAGETRSILICFCTGFDTAGKVGYLICRFKVLLIHDFNQMISELGLYNFYFSFLTIEGKVAKLFYHLSLPEISQVTALDPASLIL